MGVMLPEQTALYVLDHPHPNPPPSRGRERDLAALAAHAISAPMLDERTSAALGRIEQALSRIEAAAVRKPATPSYESEELARLRTAHQTLRGRVEQAVSQIDRLLATAGER